MEEQVNLMELGYRMIDAWVILGCDLMKLMARVMTPCNHMDDDMRMMSPMETSQRSDGRQTRHPVDA